MKIQLDTTKKTIKIEEDVKLTKLIDTVKKLLPNNEWKEFTLETNTTINNWRSSNTTDREWLRRNWWEFPWYSYAQNNTLADPTLEVRAGTAEYTLNNGVYNIEAQ